MQAHIFTPRAHFDMIEKSEAIRAQPNRQTNTVIEVGDYQISVAMDSSHGTGDLFRTEILVFKKADEKDISFMKNVTDDFKKIVHKELNYGDDFAPEQFTMNNPFELSVILNEVIRIQKG